MPKRVPNQKYTPEFKAHVIKTMREEKRNNRETSRLFEINDHHRVQAWERIYLEEGPEGFLIESRG